MPLRFNFGATPFVRLPEHSPLTVVFKAPYRGPLILQTTKWQPAIDPTTPTGRPGYLYRVDCTDGNGDVQPFVAVGGIKYYHDTFIYLDQNLVIQKFSRYYEESGGATGFGIITLDANAVNNGIPAITADNEGMAYFVVSPGGLIARDTVAVSHYVFANGDVFLIKNQRWVKLVNANDHPDPTLTYGTVKSTLTLNVNQVANTPNYTTGFQTSVITGDTTSVIEVSTPGQTQKMLEIGGGLFTDKTDNSAWQYEDKDVIIGGLNSVAQNYLASRGWSSNGWFPQEFEDMWQANIPFTNWPADGFMCLYSMARKMWYLVYSSTTGNTYILKQVSAIGENMDGLSYADSGRYFLELSFESYNNTTAFRVGAFRRGHDILPEVFAQTMAAPQIPLTDSTLYPMIVLRTGSSQVNVELNFGKWPFRIDPPVYPWTYRGSFVVNTPLTFELQDSPYYGNAEHEVSKRNTLLATTKTHLQGSVGNIKNNERLEYGDLVYVPTNPGQPNVPISRPVEVNTNMDWARIVYLDTFTYTEPFEKKEILKAYKLSPVTDKQQVHTSPYINLIATTSAFTGANSPETDATLHRLHVVNGPIRSYTYPYTVGYVEFEYVGSYSSSGQHLDMTASHPLRFMFFKGSAQANTEVVATRSFTDLVPGDIIGVLASNNSPGSIDFYKNGVFIASTALSSANVDQNLYIGIKAGAVGVAYTHRVKINTGSMRYKNTAPVSGVYRGIPDIDAHRELFAVLTGPADYVPVISWKDKVQYMNFSHLLSSRFNNQTVTLDLSKGATVELNMDCDGGAGAFFSEYAFELDIPNQLYTEGHNPNVVTVRLLVKQDSLGNRKWNTKSFIVGNFPLFLSEDEMVLSSAPFAVDEFIMSTYDGGVNWTLTVNRGVQ